LPIINIEKKEVIYQSPIYFTPIIEGELIDFHKLQNYIKVAFKESKIKKEEIATVPVIITGETARKGSRNLSVPWYQTFTNSECRLWKQEHKSYPL
jgi:ethanolamine utilization protein EutA